MGKLEKEAWFEVAQLCEQNGVPMGPVLLYRKACEQFHYELQKPGGVEKAMQLMGVAKPKRRHPNDPTSLQVVAILVCVVSALIIIAKLQGWL